jgi:hypothetical protein
MVERTLIRPPSSRVGTITDDERREVIASSPIGTMYDAVVDRQSAFEVLSAKVETTVQTETVQQPVSTQPPPPPDAAEAGGGLGGLLSGIFGTNRPRNQRLTTTQRITREVTRTVTGRVVGGVAAELGRQVGGSVGGSVGRAIIRGVLGGMLR